MQYKHIKTDVLIMGGGASGAVAAIEARKKGASAVIMEKGKLERSGCSGTGQSGFLGYAHQRGPHDNKEGFLRHAVSVAKGACDVDLLDAVICSEMDEAVQMLERLGVLIHDKDGRISRFDLFNGYCLWVDGRVFKPTLAAEVRNLGCTVLDRTCAIKLIVKDGVVAGAIGFNIRTGELYLVEAKATLVATGRVDRLTLSNSGNPFTGVANSTGDGQVYAYMSGASLTNIEYMTWSLGPKDLQLVGASTFGSMGVKYMNHKGEHYLDRYPPGTASSRYAFVTAALKEISDGNGPVYWDCRHLSPEKIAELIRNLEHDYPCWPDFLKQRGIDLKTDPVELRLGPGLHFGGGSFFAGGGIQVDKNCFSGVPGLFSSGDSASYSNSFHGAFCGGMHAGKAAADYALAAKSTALDIPAVENELKQALAPLQRKNGIPYREVEDENRRIMMEFNGLSRTHAGLKLGLERSRKLQARTADALLAKDLHEVMRANETISLLKFGELSMEASLYRKETRCHPFFHREDYPDQDDQNWSGFVVVRKAEQGRSDISFEPVAY